MTDRLRRLVEQFLKDLRPIERSAAWAREHSARSPSSHQEFIRQADENWSAYEKTKAELEAALDAEAEADAPRCGQCDQPVPDNGDIWCVDCHNQCCAYGLDVAPSAGRLRVDAEAARPQEWTNADVQQLEKRGYSREFSPRTKLVVSFRPVLTKTGPNLHAKDRYIAKLECGHEQETHSTRVGGPHRVDRCWTCEPAAHPAPEEEGR